MYVWDDGHRILRIFMLKVHTFPLHPRFYRDTGEDDESAQPLAGCELVIVYDD